MLASIYHTWILWDMKTVFAKTSSFARDFLSFPPHFHGIFHDFLRISMAFSMVFSSPSPSGVQVPLWLRLEQNHIDDAEAVFRRLQARPDPPVKSTSQEGFHVNFYLYHRLRMIYDMRGLMPAISILHQHSTVYWIETLQKAALPTFAQGQVQRLPPHRRKSLHLAHLRVTWVLNVGKPLVINQCGKDIYDLEAMENHHFWQANVRINHQLQDCIWQLSISMLSYWRVAVGLLLELRICEKRL